MVMAKRAQASKSVAADARVQGKGTLLPDMKRMPMVTVSSVMRHWHEWTDGGVAANVGCDELWRCCPGYNGATALNLVIVPRHVVRSQVARSVSAPILPRVPRNFAHVKLTKFITSPPRRMVQV
jgi:hypothetical protein